jgi:thioesterase domain-containing protein
MESMPVLVESSLAPIADLESELLDLWKKFLKRSDLTIDDDFFESGGDSLLATELLFEMERLVKHSVLPSLIFETGTVRQVAARLSANVASQPGVKIGGKTGRMFHFFHGDFNYGGASVRKLETMLGPDRPILAVAPHGMDDERLPASIEEMAAERLPLILEAQPRGPYAMGGHCNGALVAFEASRLLVRAGHTVDLVVMIDPVVARRSAQLFLRALDLAQRTAGFPAERRRASRALAWTKFVRADMVRRLDLRPSAAQSMRRGGTVSTNSGPTNRHRPRLNPTQSERLRAYAGVMSDYSPSCLEVPILYVALSCDGRGWRQMSSQIEFIDLPGQHNPGAAIWERVRARLDALDAPMGA